MQSGIFGHLSAITCLAIGQSAVVFEGAFNLLRKFGIYMIEDIDNNKSDIGPCDGSFTGVAGEEQLGQQIEDLDDFIADGQIGGVDKIYAAVALVSLSNLVNQFFNRFIC